MALKENTLFQILPVTLGQWPWPWSPSHFNFVKWSYLESNLYKTTWVYQPAGELYLHGVFCQWLSSPFIKIEMTRSQRHSDAREKFNKKFSTLSVFFCNGIALNPVDMLGSVSWSLSDSGCFQPDVRSWEADPGSVLLSVSCPGLFRESSGPIFMSI